MVGTLSLAAGDFDGSGVDQLMVGSAYWSGRSIGIPDGTYQKGTLVTQPVVFLIKGGQGSGTISGAASAGAGSGTTNLTVSLGKQVYLLRQVTVSGATGSWAAINGTWQVTPTTDGFSLPVDSSQFGSFDGQTVQVNVAAPLTQADTKELDAFPGLAGYSPGPIRIDEADRDARIRVQMLPGVFHFDPGKGFGYRRRQVAVAWNARPAASTSPYAVLDGDPHLAIIQVSNDDKITVAAAENGLFGAFQGVQTLSMAAGAFRGDNDTHDPTWSVFLSAPRGTAQVTPFTAGQVHSVFQVAPDATDPNKLQLTRVCSGKEDMVGYSTDSTSGIASPYYCQIWGDDAKVELPDGNTDGNNRYERLPAIAADLNGNSLKLGAPVHYEITKPVKAQFILEQPPQHAAYFDDGSGNGAQVHTINRYPSFNTSMQDSQKHSVNSNNKDHTDWTVGGSAQYSASYQQSFGLAADDTGVGERVKVAVTAKLSYDYDNVSENYTTTAGNFTVTQQNATGTDDVLIYNSEILDLWRYRIFGNGADTGDPQKPYAYYDIVLPGTSSYVSYPGGRDVDWYQPVHEPGNILSYPSRTSVCNPSDIGPITVQDKNIVNQVIPLIACTQQYYNGNSSSISLNFDHTTTTGSSTDYTHKIHADLDVSASVTAGASLGGIGTALGTSGADLDVHGGADWGQLTTSDDSTSASTGITVNSPQGDSNHAYPYYPIFYDTDAGALKVAFAVGDLTASGAGGGFWTSYYGQQPDPALNLPNRFNATYSDNGVLNGWEADNTINRKRMKGIVIRSSQKDPRGQYPLLGRNPRDGDTVIFETRIYNYSVSSTPTSPITVQLSVIPMDNRNNEICRSAGGTQPAYTRGGHVCPVGDRTVIGNASSAPVGGTQTATLNARENKLMYFAWPTKGYGPPQGVTPYRVYVDLIGDPKNEIYPPEKPCTALPCDSNLSIEKDIDPGQNNEGWSLISVEAPAQRLQAGGSSGPVPDAAQLALGSDTPLLGGPEGNFLEANLRQPFPLRLTAFSTQPTPLHSYVSIYDGKPGEPGTQMIASKIVRGLRPDGATVWQNWTPSTLVPHHLYATVQNSNGAQPLGDLVVDVQRSIGDVNGDGRVDSHDLNILTRDLGKSVAESACGPACDIDGDGSITETDRILMANLCDWQGCAFATSEYVGGARSPLEPDMRTLRQSDLTARTAWFAANPEGGKALYSASPVSNGLVAYGEELQRKHALHSIQYYYKGNPVTTGPMAPWPTVPPVQTAIYADPATGTNENEVVVPLVIVNNGTDAITALELSQLRVQTLAGSGQAAIISSDFGLPGGSDFVPGASNKVSVRLRVPTTVRKLKLTETGSLASETGSGYQFSSAQIVFP